MSESVQSRSAAPPYELVGREEGVRRLVDAFYDVMAQDPAFARLRAIHARDLAPMRAGLADFLTQWMGGPRVYAQRNPGRACIFSAHAPFKIDKAMAEDWMACMRKAFEAAAVPDAFRGMVEPVLASMCRNLRNVAE